MENSLPKGWSVIKLNDLCNLVYGKGLLTKELSENGYPVFGANGIIGHYSKYTYAEPKVIISCRGAASGAIHLTQPKSFVTSNSIVLDMITEEISNDYLKYAMLSIDRTQIVTGTAQPQITIENLKDLEVPLSPLDEQHRIVAKLDALLARVTNCKNRLEKIPALLKNFRQSVLAAAVSGELTKEWREKNEAEVWGEDILKIVADVIDPHPSHRTPPEVEDGIPYIGIGDINTDDTIDFKNARRVSKEILNEHKIRYSLSKGDFIFGKIGTIGKPVRIPVEQNYTLSANVILIKPKKKKVEPSFLFYYLDSKQFIEEVNLETKATSQPAFGIKKMREKLVPIPDLKEQKEIVRKVEELFHFADSIEARYQKAKAWFDKIPQAILAKAFRGELVEQDGNDEPATVLLERIKKEKQNTNKPKPTAKRKKVYEENEGVSLAAEE